MSAPCCDDHGWKLDPRGQPVEPAVRCSRHPRKSGATNKPADPAPADAPDTRDGNKHKFAWFYEMLADPSVSIKGKAIGSGCVMKLAGRKGYFKATRKAIATLCGTSHATVRRALQDLIDKKFLVLELGEGAGAANTYHLILPAQRLAQWLDAEKGYEGEIADAQNAIHKWLFAENRWCNEQTELLFRDAVFDASIARGADAARATLIAERLAARVREEGDELEVDLGLEVIASWKDETFAPAAPPAETVPSGDPEAAQKRADPGSTVSRPRLNGEPTPAQRRADPGSTVSRPRLTTDADTSGDDETHKSFKDFERPVKVFQDSESDPALRGALARPLRPVRFGVGECDLCDTDGRFLDPDGYPVVLGEWFDNDDQCIEHPVDCQHSMVGNLAEIQRREKAEDVELMRTGWPEIDAHYPKFNGDKVATNPNP